MSIPKSVQQYLRKSNIPFEVIKHKLVYTAYDLAATLKEKLEGIGKTLLIKTDNGFVLVLLPANRRLDLAKLKKALGAKSGKAGSGSAGKLSIVSEKEMMAKLKVQAGGLTSFGTLHKAEVFVDSALLKASKILVAAGSFTDHVRMKAKDLVKLEQAKTGNASVMVKLPALPQKMQKSRKNQSRKKKKQKRIP